MWRTIRNIARQYYRKSGQRRQERVLHGHGNQQGDDTSLMQRAPAVTTSADQIDADLAYHHEGWWLIQLQSAIERLKADGHQIGAHVSQVLYRMNAWIANALQNVRGPAADRIAMMFAVLQSYSGEESNEGVDHADAWAASWEERLICYVLPRVSASVNEDAVPREESQEQEGELAETRETFKPSRPRLRRRTKNGTIGRRMWSSTVTWAKLGLGRA